MSGSMRFHGLLLLWLPSILGLEITYTVFYCKPNFCGSYGVLPEGDMVSSDLVELALDENAVGAANVSESYFTLVGLSPGAHCLHFRIREDGGTIAETLLLFRFTLAGTIGAAAVRLLVTSCADIDNAATCEHRPLGDVKLLWWSSDESQAFVREEEAIANAPAFDCKFRYRIDPYASHQPVLHRAVSITDGPVLELGTGYGSTPMLHALLNGTGRRLVSIDENSDWLHRFTALQSDWHDLVQLTDSSWHPAALEQLGVFDTFWSVVLVDQDPLEVRTPILKLLGDRARYIVLHDCDWYPVTGALYYSHYRNFLEFYPAKPFPSEGYGPPTLVASNSMSLAEFTSIDFWRYEHEYDGCRIGPPNRT